MILNRAIKMRIYPDDEQRHKIDVTLKTFLCEDLLY